MSLSSENKMAAIHVVQINTHVRFPRSKKWPTHHVPVPTGTLKLLNKAFSEKIAQNFDLHLLLGRLLSFVALIITFKVRGWVTDTHTHTDTQTKYCNPRCACAPRVNKDMTYSSSWRLWFTCNAAANSRAPSSLIWLWLRLQNVREREMTGGSTSSLCVRHTEEPLLSGYRWDHHCVSEIWRYL